MRTHASPHHILIPGDTSEIFLATTEAAPEPEPEPEPPIDPAPQPELSAAEVAAMVAQSEVALAVEAEVAMKPGKPIPQMADFLSV